MKFFVSLNLDLNKTTMDGWSPLMLSIKKQNLESIIINFFIYIILNFSYQTFN